MPPAAFFLHAYITVQLLNESWSLVTSSRQQAPFLKGNKCNNWIQRSYSFLSNTAVLFKKSQDGVNLNCFSNESGHKGGRVVSAVLSNYGPSEDPVTIIERDGKIINVSSIWKRVSLAVTPAGTSIRGCIFHAVSTSILTQLLQRVLLVARAYATQWSVTSPGCGALIRVSCSPAFALLLSRVAEIP